MKSKILQSINIPSTKYGNTGIIFSAVDDLLSNWAEKMSSVIEGISDPDVKKRAQDMMDQL